MNSFKTQSACILLLIAFASCTFQNIEEENLQTEIKPEIKEEGGHNHISGPAKTDQNNARKIDAEVIQRINTQIHERKLKNIAEIVSLYRAKDEYAEGDYSYTLLEQELEKGAKQVVLEETGLADDSVEGVRVVFILIKGTEYYQISSIYEQYRCRQGRGSIAWNKKRCI